jgi:type IV pilus assembly protein PilQ
MKHRKWCLWLSGLLASTTCHAGMSLDLQDVSVPDAIHFVAKASQMNIILSSSVSGSVTLHVHDMAPDQIMDLILELDGLSKIKKGGVWYVATREELTKSRQEELKWLTAKEEAEPLVTQVWQVRYAKAEDIVKLFQSEHAGILSKRGSMRADVRTNVIFIHDSLERISAAKQVITKLDVPVKQILIEARLVSIDYDYERELGIHFATVSPSLVNTHPQESGRYSIAVVKLADGSLLDVKLAALENAGKARLISSPSLFAANQEQASIEAGEEIPYQEVSESGGTAVVFKKAVLGLKVTPQVLPGARVLLRMQINQDRPSNKMVQGVPTISTRQIVTSALIKNGQTIVLGGIYETDWESGLQGLPYISKVPVLGGLFKETHLRENKRELLIFVTPKIMTEDL